MTIRPVSRDDLPELRAAIDATALFPGDMLDGMVEPHLSGDASEEIWITADEDGPVALAFAAAERMTEGTWNMLLIAIHPSRQRHGIGVALLAAVEATLRQGGARLLLVETSGRPEFDATRRFYNALGFAEEGHIRAYYKPCEDKIIFAKPVA